MYSLGFEKAVYALQKPGDISSPFLNEYGYNIIKLLEIIPVNNKEGDVVNQGSLQQLVLGSDRLALARNNLVKQWLVVTKYKKGVYNETDLWKYTDSAIVKHTKAVNAIDSATVLFSFPGKKTTVNDWVNYVKSARLQAASSPKKSYQVLLTDFTRQTCNEYYRNHIEEYNAPIADQMSQFNEANLLFAVMDKHVWGKASLDTVALQQFYTENKKNYTWAPGVSALTITCAKKEIIDSIAQKIKTAPAAWRKITGAYGNVVNADSSRYENGQLPLKQPVPMQAGFASSPEQTQSGDGWIFVYVFNVYPQQSQRSFEDAKGMVINDYQQVLENNWLETLKKKYTVTINEKVVESLK
jgi:peptidyl-prolyl cis-trans isomerase SurA